MDEVKSDAFCNATSSGVDGEDAAELFKLLVFKKETLEAMLDKSLS